MASDAMTAEHSSGKAPASALARASPSGTLSADAAVLFEKAKKRLDDIKVIKLNSRKYDETRNYAASLADKIFSQLASNHSASNRRKFVALMLDLANLKYPNPDSSPARFDAMLKTPI